MNKFLVTTQPSMSDDAVHARTGRTWSEWFETLDGEGAVELAHPQIVSILRNRYGVSDWWCQMVTVTYEQARGLRQKHEKVDGFQISRTKTYPIGVDFLIQAFRDPDLRGRWLGNTNLTIVSASAGKSLHAMLNDRSSVEVSFTVRSHEKTQVTVTHRKLADAQAAEAMKAFWSASLERLAEWIHLRED